MLKIKIGSTWIDAANLDIPVTLRSPLFLQNGRIPGSYVFNFQLPLTQALKAEICYRNRPATAAGNLQKKPFYLEAGPLKYSGDCSIKATAETTAEISAPINTGSLAALLKERKMSDINLGGVRLEPALNRVEAISTDDFSYNRYETDPFTEEDQLVFDNIIVNELSELNVAGSEFTAASTGVLIMIFDFDFHIVASRIEVRIKVNGITVKTFYPTWGTEKFVARLSINENDVVTWWLYLEPEEYNNPPDFDYYISGDLYAGSRLHILAESNMMYNGAANLYPDSDYAVFPLENPDLLSNLHDDMYAVDNKSLKEIQNKFYPIVNYYVDGVFPTIMQGMANDEVFNAWNLFVPFPYLAYFIKKMAEQLNLVIENNEFESDDLKQLCIYNAYAENDYLESNLSHIIEGFDLKNHVPDEKLSDFINEVTKLLGIAIDFNSYTRTLRFKNLIDIISDRTFIHFPGMVDTAPALTFEPKKGYKLTQASESDEFVRNNFRPIGDVKLLGSLATYHDLPDSGNEVNDCYFITLTRVYMYWAYDEEESVLKWLPYSYDFQHVFENIDENEEGDVVELTSNWSAVMDSVTVDHNINAPTDRIWRIPRIDQPGNFEGTPSNFASKFSKCLLFYRGMQKDSHDANYPLGTNSVYRYPWVKLDGANLELRWDGPYGLWEKKHKAWIEWLAASPGYWTMKAYLSLLELSRLDFFKWYRIMNHDFLIKEIKFNISQRGVSTCELDLMRR